MLVYTTIRNIQRGKAILGETLFCSHSWCFITLFSPFRNITFIIICFRCVTKYNIIVQGLSLSKANVILPVPAHISHHFPLTLMAQRLPDWASERCYWKGPVSVLCEMAHCCLVSWCTDYALPTANSAVHLLLTVNSVGTVATNVQ